MSWDARSRGEISEMGKLCLAAENRRKKLESALKVGSGNEAERNVPQRMFGSLGSDHSSVFQGTVSESPEIFLKVQQCPGESRVGITGRWMCPCLPAVTASS